MSWYISVLRNYADFSGRARRKEYWMFFLFNVIISFGIGFLFGLVGGVLKMGTAISTPVSLIYGLAVLVPGIAVGVRRMHDTGRSGWWILCPFLNLVFLCVDSQPGTNQYGLNPKNIHAMTIAATA